MLFEAFKENREKHPEAAAFLVTSGDRSLPISWRRFTDDIETVAYLIENQAPGATVGVLGENSYEWITAHAAAIFSGARVVPVDINLTPAEVASRLRFVGARLLVHSALYAAKARATAALMPGLAIAGFGTLETDRYLDEARSRLAAGAKGLWSRPAESVDVRRTAMLVFTSGTTSEPRGAELTIESMETFAMSADLQLRMKFGQRSLMLLPLHHIFGVCTTYMMLAKGVALGVCPDFRRIYDAVERFRVNFIFLVPALTEILAARIEQHGRSAEEALGCSIDWILVGGAPLPRRTFERMQSLGVRMITGYGLTETAAVYSIAPAVGDPRPGSAGQASRLPGVETRVSETGELLIRGPAVMKGYYKSPEHTARVIDPEGWFHTGDIGRIDADGFVWITGRASRTIILSSGKKIAPEELEEKLLALPGVLEAMVSGDGEKRDVCAEIYASVSETSVKRLVSELNATLPIYKRIKRVKVRTEPFPRTSSGKIRVG